MARWPTTSASPHGTRARYCIGRCRCDLCREAARRYGRANYAARKAGQLNKIVSAAPAREHIRKLARAGVGYRMVAEAASLPKSVVLGIKNGSRANARKQSIARILAVTIDCRGDRTLVSAASTWRRIEKLLEEGFTKRDIARRLFKGANPSLQFGRQRVTVRTRARIERLFEKLTN